MLKIISLFIFLLCSKYCLSQSFLNFGDSQTIVVNDVEFGYSIEKEQLQQIDGTEYSILTIKWYLTNKDRFSKIFVISQYTSGEDVEVDLTRKICLAKLHIRNAIGSSFSTIIDEPNISLKVIPGSRLPIPVIFRKREQIPAFYLKSGATLSNTIETKLPKGKKPDIALHAFVSQVY